MFGSLRPHVPAAAFRLAMAALGCLAAPAAAQVLPVELGLTGDVRMVGADGEQSWLDGGFGKSRFSGARDGDFRLRPEPAEAMLVWQPTLGWGTKALVSVAAQQGQEHPVDLVESFLSLKSPPTDGTRLSGRLGMFWPPVSLEHESGAWQVADMITPSAINSWIGEEVKVIGAEATASRDVGGHRLSATLGLFGWNDTAGTLLAFRGWALSDFKATAFSHQKLPELSDEMEEYQAPRTRPTIEIDGRPGFYARLAWQGPVSLEALYYDNRGDPEAVTSTLLWGWRTRFLNVGARGRIGERTTILAQAMTGTTVMGYDEGEGIWVDTRFRAAYLRLTHRTGIGVFSTRLDLFGTRERGAEMDGDTGEDGWAATGAGSFPLSDHFRLIVELLHIDSRRDGRLREAIDPQQSQTVVQTALRLSL